MHDPRRAARRIDRSSRVRGQAAIHSRQTRVADAKRKTAWTIERRSGTAQARGSAKQRGVNQQALKGMKTHERRFAGPVFGPDGSKASTGGTGDARHGAESHADAERRARERR